MSKTFTQFYGELKARFPGEFVAIHNQAWDEDVKVIAHGTDRLDVVRRADAVIPPKKLAGGHSMISYALLDFTRRADATVLSKIG